MNANRDLIWGIALSILVHGALLGLPISPGGRGFILPHQPISLEISLVTLKAHEDAPPKKKPVPLTQPERVRQSVTAAKEKTTKRKEEPVPALGEKPLAAPKEKKVLTPKSEPVIPPPLGKITTSAPEPEEKLEQKAPLPSVRNLLGKKGLKASLIPKGENHASGSRPVTLARPRYDRNPKPPYPRIARRKGYQGVVVLKVEILPSGRVGEIRVKESSSHPMLDRSALKTVRQWRFIPAKRGGDPIRMWAEIPIRFELE
jgi:protein TonB